MSRKNEMLSEILSILRAAETPLLTWEVRARMGDNASGPVRERLCDLERDGLVFRHHESQANNILWELTPTPPEAPGHGE